MSITSTDPIADMLTRIRNAIAVRKTEVVLPYSKVKEAVATVLADNRFIKGVSVTDETGIKMLKLNIMNENENAAITEIVRLSKPGRRYYTGADKIPAVKGGRGIVVVSTSQGLMTGQEAKRKKLGGELMCKVY